MKSQGEIMGPFRLSRFRRSSHPFPAGVVFLLLLTALDPPTMASSEHNDWPGPGLDAVHWEMYVSDFNGDGLGDLFFRNKTPIHGGGPARDPLFYLALNRGGAFDSVIAYDAPGNAPGFYASQYELYLGDFNKDGYTDLVARDSTVSPAVFRVGLNIGNILFESEGPFSYGDSTAPDLNSEGWELFVKDFDGDGDCDLIGRNKVSGDDPMYMVGINRGNDFWGGGGPWEYRHNYNNIQLPYDDWEMYLFDANGDDTLDILGRNRNGSPLFWLGIHRTESFTRLFEPFRTYDPDSLNVFDLDASHFDLVLDDATGDGRADLIGRRLAWTWAKHYVAERLGTGEDVRFVEDEADTLDWWNVPDDFGNDGGRIYYYGDFNGDSRVDILGRDPSGGSYYVAENSCNSATGMRDFLAAEPWRYVGIEGDEELLNANYIDSIYMVDNLIYLKGVTCELGSTRNGTGSREIRFIKRGEGTEICRLEFGFSLSDLAVVRNYANNITLESDKLVMSAKADGSFWFFLRTVDDTVRVHDPVAYDYRRYAQRTNNDSSDSTTYIHLNDEMGYGFFSYDVFGSFEGDRDDYLRILDVDGTDPVVCTSGNAAFIVNVFPAGKEIDARLLGYRFLTVHPRQYRDTLNIAHCDSLPLRTLPDTATVRTWTRLTTTNEDEETVRVGANAMILFEDIWVRNADRVPGSPAPYQECGSVYNPEVGGTLSNHVFAYKSVPGMEKVLLYVSAYYLYNRLTSRPDSSTADLFLAEIDRLWRTYHDDLPPGRGIDGFYIDTLPLGSYPSEYHVDDGGEIYTPITLGYEIVRGVRRIIGERGLLYLHTSESPFGFERHPAPHLDTDLYIRGGPEHEIFTPFLDVYADYVLRGEGGPMFAPDSLFYDDGTVDINDHLHYVCRTRNRSNTIGSAKTTTTPARVRDPGNCIDPYRSDPPDRFSPGPFTGPASPSDTSAYGETVYYPHLHPFNPIRKDRMPIPYPDPCDSAEVNADIQARYFQGYLGDGSMILWKGAEAGGYRDEDDFLPRWTQDYDTYESQLINFWRWLKEEGYSGPPYHKTPYSKAP